MTVLADHAPTPTAPVDFAELAEDVEAFITYPVPYEFDEGRARLRAEVRTVALASLLGTLADLIETGAVTEKTVAAAIRVAITAGVDHQLAQTATAPRGL